MMKNKFKKINLMFAAAAVAATAFGGAVFTNASVASADAVKYNVKDIFATSNANGLVTTEVGTGESKKNVVTFTLGDESYGYIKRDLAFKWFEAGAAKYFTLKMSFKTLDFKTVTLTVDSESAWATKEEQMTNTITFTNDNGTVKAKVNGGDKVATIANPTEAFTVTLGESADAKDGEFSVTVTDSANTATTLDSFTNVGANYAKYSYGDEKFPIKITADLGENPAVDAKQDVLVWEVNGQKFDAITTESSVLKVEDTAAPVLVVNEQIDGFLLGTAFSLDYTVLDVLKSTSLTKTLQYYQYNPTVALSDDAYETLTTSTYFMETSYKVDGSDEYKSVYREKGKEYVSIKIKVGDGTFTGDTAAVYNLSWYANANAVETVDGNPYIIIDRNEEGPKYNAVTDTDVETFENSLLADAAKDVAAGSNSYIYFPSFKWLLDDNNGYRNLKFTISYKTPSSTSPSTSSSLSYNGLKLSVSEEGTYEFKIFATDKAGNAMKAMLDGEEVDVTSSNVWDIESIPSFKFTIKNQGLKVEDETNNYKDTEILDKSYSFDDFKVVGANSLKEEYALYKLNLCQGLDVDDLIAVKYETLAGKLTAAGLATAKANGDYFKYYLDVYADILAEKTGVKKADILASFVKVGEAGDRINNATDEFEKYNWNASAQSMTTVEVGEYLLLADFWEEEIVSQRAVGYRVLVVESEEVKIKGDSEWLKNNVVSVILFAVAGVMLILIIILLLIKPSDETLEDIDGEAAKKETKKKKDK